MKRYIIILLSALAIIVAGCAKDVVTKAPAAGDDAWMYDETLPVPVQFGGADVKSMINSISQINNKTFGVFAFDKFATDLRDDDGFMIRNASAVGVASATAGSLKLTQPAYYPNTSDTEFTFYSFYAYPIDQVTYEITRTKALVNIPVSGVYDVLWAKAETAGGYNAVYMRDGGAHPAFSFSHPAACLSFKACIDEKIEGTDVRLTALSIVAPAEATLCITDIVDRDKEGKFVAVGENVDRPALTGGFSSSLSCVLTTEPQRFCQDMFIVPGGDKMTVKASFVIRSPGADKVLNTSDDIIQRTSSELVLKPRNGGVFEAGMIYTFHLKMRTPEELTFELDSDDLISVKPFEPAFK